MLLLLRHLLSQSKSVRNFTRTFSINSSFKFAVNKMAEHSYVGKPLAVIMESLEEFAPLSYASSWDNVGLLVDPNCESSVNTVLLTNDLTEEIVAEAVAAKAGLIISYHPNIFQGLKSVSQRTWKERIVVECIKNEIAVFSPHTSWDAVAGGVNDWLAKSLPIESCIPVQQLPMLPHIGAGRFCVLREPVTVDAAIEMIKKHIGINHLRLALAKNATKDSLIRTVALCAGSGSSVLNGIEADLYLTGEMMHHDVLDAAQNGIHVILCNHSDSERGFLHDFRETLETTILKGEAKVIISKIDRDPLVTV